MSAVRFRLGAAWRGRAGPPWLEVACDWCGGGVQYASEMSTAPHHTGCLVCAVAQVILTRVTADRRFLALRREVSGDRREWGILADWLQDEYGIEVALCDGHG